MADTDIAKVVSLIMENPQLVEEIKNLAEKQKAEEPVENAVGTEACVAEPEPARETAAIQTGAALRPRRRGELLEALKPYMSDERKKAIDSFMTIADILDMMRAK